MLCSGISRFSRKSVIKCCDALVSDPAWKSKESAVERGALHVSRFSDGYAV